jgi:DNA-binding GntR family transcriptional regulator
MYTRLYDQGVAGGTAIHENSEICLAPILASGGARLAEQAYQALRAAIEDGRLEPGQRIPELELCASLRISRTPVREALRRMQSDGMVVPAPGGGLAVAQHDLRAIAELYDLRESLEGTAAALAARNADRTELGVLQGVLAAHRSLPKDAKIHARENKILHEHIYRAAHNRFLLKSLQGLHDALAVLGRTTFAAPGRIAAAWEEHAAIIAAIARRDEAEAEALARHHVRHAYEIRLEQMTRAVTKGGPPR